MYHCHNCNVTMLLYNLLKQVSPPLYDRYCLEVFQSKNTKSVEDKPSTLAPSKIAVASNDALKSLKKISTLDPKHPAKLYVVSRQIPTILHAELFWAPKFKEFSNTVVSEKFDLSSGKDEGRLIIPLLDQNNKMFGFQGRSLNPKATLRYISIKSDESMPKVYGLHRVNMNKKFYVVEGPIDAMFIPNTVATCGGDLLSELKKVRGNIENGVIVYDNQPRNKEVVNGMLTAVKEGYKVCVWPASLNSKDINDMILSRVPPGEYVRTEEVMKAAEEIKSIIDKNTHSGLQAELRIANWRKS